MKVSIVVPVYNVERYLRTCLDSLRNQTLSDIEIICVNDGSTDTSLEILREYEQNDSRFKVITKDNAGYGHTMNQGFAAATGDYVCVLESDDFCDEHMCEVLYNTAVNEDADIVISNITKYWSEPTEHTELVKHVWDEENGKVVNPREYQRCFVIPPVLCCMAVRRSIITDNNLRLLETPGASYQDTAFSFKLWACANKAVMLTDSFVFYRQDNEASSINQTNKPYAVADEYHEIERFIKEDLARFGELFPIEQVRKFGAYQWNYKRLAQSFHLEFAQFASKEFTYAELQGFIDPKLYWIEEYADLRLLIDNPEAYVARMDIWTLKEVSRYHLRWRIRRKLGKVK